MKKIRIGRISGAQGLRGEVRLFHDSGDEGAIGRLTSLFLRSGGAETAFRIEWHRMQKRTPVFKLEGVDDRDAAEALVGSAVYTLEEESRPAGEGAWLESDLIGLEARIGAESNDGAESEAVAAAGRIKGTVKGIIDNPAHDILQIEIDGVVRLLPFVDIFVTEVKPESGYIRIFPPSGWLD